MMDADSFEDTPVRDGSRPSSDSGKMNPVHVAYRDQLGYNAWRDRIAHLSPPSAQKRARRPRNAGNRAPRRRIIP